MKALAMANLLGLSRNPYPGRGIVVGMDEAGRHMVQVYWVMGRSENSRNRVLSSLSQRVFTEPADPAKVKDPRLIIYNAMREDGQVFVVSNGHQTDDIFSAGSMVTGLLSHTYEPDAPNFTPRISGACAINKGRPYFQLGILRKSPWGVTCDRAMYSWDEIAPGFGYCVTTYSGDGDPLPAFAGDPLLMPVNGGDIETVGATFWSLLNNENRVALVVKFIEMSGATHVRLFNKFPKV